MKKLLIILFALLTYYAIAQDTISYGNYAIKVIGSDVFINNNLVNADVLNIQNSDKILLLGVSGSLGLYAIKNKSFASKVSNLIDMPIYNRSQSVHRIPQLASKLITDYAQFSDGGMRTLKPKYIVWGVTVDYGVESGFDESHYLEQINIAIQASKAIGAIPIFRTDYLGNHAIDVMFYKLAQNNNLIYNSALNGHELMCEGGGYGYNGFWAGSHVGTRTNVYYEMEMLRLLKNIKPSKSIKIFNTRPDYMSGIPMSTDLIYDNNLERIKYYYEIGSGLFSLSVTDMTYGQLLYDKLDTTVAFESFTDQYSAIRQGNDVLFNDYALIEFTLDKINCDLFTVNVKIDTEPDSLFLANNNSATKAINTSHQGAAFKVTKTIYDAFSESVGESFTSPAYTNPITYSGKFSDYSMDGYWLFFNATESPHDGVADSITKVSGGAKTPYSEANAKYGSYRYQFYNQWGEPKSVFESHTYTYNATTDYLTVNIISNVQDYMDFDKIKLLIKKSGAFNISDVFLVYKGGDKKPEIIKELQPKGGYTELNTDTGFKTNWIAAHNWVGDSAWNEQLPVDVRDYPNIHSTDRHIKLGFEGTNGFPDTITKNFTISSSTGYRKIIVKVIARVYPKIYDLTEAESDYYTHTPQIDYASYDYGTLICGLKFGEHPYGVMKELVDIGWSEITFESFIPPYETSMDIMLCRDPADEIDGNYKNFTFPLHIYNVSVQIDD